MEAEEIRKWKRSVMKRLEAGEDLGPEARAGLTSSVALWEIALQLAMLNERERISLDDLRTAVVKNLGVTLRELRKNQRMVEKNRARLDALVPAGTIRETQKDVADIKRRLKTTRRTVLKTAKALDTPPN